MRRWERVFTTPREERAARRRRRTPMPKINLLDTEGRWNPHNEDEFLWWPRVLWIDPGVVSGVAVVWFDPQALLVDQLKTPKVLLAYSELFLHGPEYGIGGQVDRFVKLRDKLGSEPGLAVGCESFTVLQPNQSEDFLSPVRIRAGIDMELSKTKPLGADRIGQGVPLLTQSPVDAKSAFTNARLTALRMYTEGPDHVNDAKRHCLLHVRRLKAHRDSLGNFKELHGHEEGWFA